MHRTIAWLIEHGVETYDLLANPAEYKRDYSNAKVVLSGHAINLTSRGVLYTSLWTRTLKPMLRAAFVRLPDPLRNALAALRRKELKISA